MKSVKEEFPNPVLAHGRDDYNANCTFCTFFDEEKISEDDKYFKIPITYSLECKGLTDLIKKKEAGIEEAKAIVKSLTDKYPLI